MADWQIDDTITALQRYDSALVANAIERFKARPVSEGYMGYDIRCIFPELGSMVGYAVTVHVDSRTEGRPVRPDAQRAYYEAIWNSPKPVVVVIKALGEPRTHTLVFGDNMATYAKSLGAIGLVTDGGVRDLAGIRELGGFHMFAPGMVVSHGVGATPGIQQVGMPVTVSGVTVNPGDIVHADESGLVIVPPEIASEVPVQAEEVRRREKAGIAVCSEPDFSLEKLLKDKGML